MHDSHICFSDYERLKDIIVDVLNGANATNSNDLADEIQTLYRGRELFGTQYSDLMRHAQDML